MKKLFLVTILIAAAAISGYIIFTAYPTVHPLGAVKLKYDLNAITSEGNRFVTRLNLNSENKTEITRLQTNDRLIRYLYDSYLFPEANRLLQEKIPGYYWELEWKKPDANVVINSNENNQQIISTGEFVLDYDAAGSLINYKRELNDSVKYTPVSEEKARQLAMDFLKKYTPVNPGTGSSVDRYHFKGNLAEQEVQKTERQTRTDYKFSWKAASADINKNLLLSVTISGDIISLYSLEYDLPDNASEGSKSIFSVATEVPFYIVIYILIIIIGYRRVRAYEISFRLALIMGLIFGITFGINLYTLISDSSTGWQLWVPLLLSTVFLSTGVFITWAVCETIARETWKEKFISLDLLTRGYAFHSRIGKSGLTGIIGGFLIYMVWIIILFVTEQFLHISIISKDSNPLISHFHSISPALSIINKSIYPQIYTVAVFFLFVFSGLRRRFGSLLVLISFSAVLWSLVNFNDMIPIYCGVITGIFIGSLFMLLFNYYDILASVFGLIMFNIIDTGVSLFTSGNNHYQISGYYLAIVLILLTVFLVIALFTRDKITNYESITPAFVKHITERQRMQRELEIARDVQMSFLPVKDPQFKGLDIAARCIPAFEVGGDYYDFVVPDKNRFGVVIGDVSGKGTQAAFYMTLAKGFVRAISGIVKSPSEFLIKLNELFYENVERGTFISMIYGIFDLNENTFTFSRAGHNPVIAKHSGKEEVDLLNPVGLALGLEKGTIFNRTIRETKINIKKGDTFVFYTDGFTEARNKYKIEFSEERLTETISKFIEYSAGQILEKTIEDVNKFTGKILQHDDMTMIVVKVLA